jgi:Spy/CpxP family protein refolding chaperone
MGAIGSLASSIPVYPTGVEMINSPRLMLSLQGLPALVDDPGRNGLARYLGLSVEQTAKIRDFTDSFYRETRNLRYELLRERIDMRKLFADPHADQAALLSKQKELSAGWRQLTDALAKTVIAAREILTAEQIEKLDRVGAD